VGWIKELESEKGIEGLVVKLIPIGKKSKDATIKMRSTTTDESGFFLFENTAIAKYKISVFIDDRQISGDSDDSVDLVIDKREFEGSYQVEREIYIPES
jgi:hypothetical protein